MLPSPTERWRTIQAGCFECNFDKGKGCYGLPFVTTGRRHPGRSAPGSTFGADETNRVPSRAEGADRTANGNQTSAAIPAS